MERNKLNVTSARVTRGEGCLGYPRPYKWGLTDELNTAEERRLNQFGSVRFGSLDLERQTTLNSAGSAALCDFGAAADSYGVLFILLRDTSPAP